MKTYNDTRIDFILENQEYIDPDVVGTFDTYTKEELEDLTEEEVFELFENLVSLQFKMEEHNYNENEGHGRAE